MGLNSSSNNLQVNLSDWNENLLWSQQNAGQLDVTIPASVLAGSIYDLTVSEEIAGKSSWEEIWKRAINKKYNLDENYKFAIFLPSAWALLDGNSSNCRKEAVAQIISDCESRGISYVVLYKKQCKWENFAYVCQDPDLSYVYMVSRGGCYPKSGDVQRTNFKITGGRVVSFKKSDYGDPNNVPPGYKELPGKWETSKKVHSMHSLNIGYSSGSGLRIVNLDFCLQGLYSDMAYEWVGFDETLVLENYMSVGILLSTLRTQITNNGLKIFGIIWGMA